MCTDAAPAAYNAVALTGRQDQPSAALYRDIRPARNPLKRHIRALLQEASEEGHTGQRAGQSARGCRGRQCSGYPSLRVRTRRRSAGHWWC